MSSRIPLGLVAVLAAVVASLGVSAPVPPKEAVKDTWIGSRLNKVIEFPGIDDPKTTLAEAVEQLAKLGDVKITFNRKAFRTAGVPEPDGVEIAVDRAIPTTKGKLGTVLAQLLDAVPADPGFGFLLRGDRVEILPESELQREIWGELAVDNPDVPRMPLVHLKAADRAFEDLLEDVAEQSDVNVVLDPRCQEKAKQALTVRLVNAPADTALATLADMVGLDLVHQRNVLYVTSAENAAKIRKEQERRMNLVPGGVNPFGLGSPPLGGMNPFGGGFGGPRPDPENPK